MELELKSMDDNDSISERRRTEIEYHRKLNVRIALACIPGFIAFTVTYYLRGSYFQALLYLLLSIDAVGIVALVRLTGDLNNLMRLKQIGSVIAFGLLGLSMVTSFFGRDIYIVFPYFFIYPIAVLLFFGERIGRYYAILFCVTTAILGIFLDFTPWNEAYIKTLKLNSAFALAIMLVIALISERTRVQMRDELIEARNHAVAAEERQRQTNLELKREIERRIQSEEALSQSEKRYRALFEESTVSLWEEDWSRVKRYLDGLPQESAEDLLTYLNTHPDEVNHCIGRMRVMAVNRAALKLYEADTQAALVKNIRHITAPEFDEQDFMANRVVALYQTGQHQTDIEAQTFSSRKLNLMISSTIPTGYEDSWERVYTSVYDITEKIAIEEEKKRFDLQLQHTRHFQVIATLAGGIAHQFNNALGGIFGNIDLLEMKLTVDEKSKRYIGALRVAASRIARLTEQLLAYARGGKFQPKALCVNTLIQELLSADIAPQFPSARIATHLDTDLYQTVGDMTQIRAVMAAVLTNAGEAVSEGGDVVVTTCNDQIAEDHPLPDSDFRGGNYVVTTIEDCGMGMDEQTRQHIFEPFFSTKFVGRGLGMSAAFGIVKNHGGEITVVSEIGKGTKVTIYLPASESSEETTFSEIVGT